MNKVLAGMCFICISFGATATLPEPDLILYGKVINQYGGAKVQLTNGTLTWRIQKQEGGGDVTKIYTTQLQSFANGQYYYRIAIPQQILIKSLPALQDLATNDNAIDATATARQFNLIAVKVDNDTATIEPPTKPWVKLGQGQRGQALEIDLKISAPLKDSDGDGMPDAWELQVSPATDEANEEVEYVKIVILEDPAYQIDGDHSIKIEIFDAD